MPAVRTAKPALAWRYPTRTPAAVKVTSPPTPGRAAAASAASERGSTPVAVRIASPATPGGATPASPVSDPGSRSSLEAGGTTVPSRAAMTLDIPGSLRRKWLAPSPRAL